jgi:hypothetical protein
MRLCPECRTGYEPAVVACKTCRVPLVDPAEMPPAEGEREWVELAEIRPVPNSVSGAMWKGALESQGLHPVIRSNALPAYGEVMRDWSARAWGMLLVPAEEAEEATLVLDDFLATAEASAPAADESDGDAGSGSGEPGLDDRVIDP